MIAEREAEPWKPRLSGTQHSIITARLRSKIDMAKHTIPENSGHFKCPKMHAMQHFVPHIERFVSLLSFDSSLTEVTHKFSIQTRYTASNRNAS
jgi:hypothetical protein